MLVTVPIECPRCGRKVSMLHFWKEYQRHYFHLCQECLNVPLSEEDLLLIGFHYGRENFREEIRKLIG